MSSTFTVVRDVKLVSCSNWEVATSTALLMGTLVNKETPSNETKTTSLPRTHARICFTNSRGFQVAWLFLSLRGDNIPTKNFDRLYVRKPMKTTMCRNGPMLRSMRSKRAEFESIE